MNARARYLVGASEFEQAAKAGKGSKVSKSHVHGTSRFNKARRRMRRMMPIPLDRPDTRKAREGIRKILLTLFKTLGPQIAADVKGDLGKMAKADETPTEKAQRIADAIDLAKFKEVYEKVAQELGATAEAASGLALAQMGVDEGSELFNQVSEKSVAWARERAAELLGMRVDSDGSIIENPNARWSVTESTRDMVRRTIEKGLEDNIGGDEIADQIEALGFTQDRADLIARTEIANANSQSSLEGYRAAREDGVEVKKEWLLGPNPCEVCQENAAAGPIDLDDEFPSGDDAPTAHPNCECALMPVVMESTGGN